MDCPERNRLARRRVEIEAELNAIADGRVVDEGPAELEERLLDELEEIEFIIGDEHFKRQGRCDEL